MALGSTVWNPEQMGRFKQPMNTAQTRPHMPGQPNLQAPPQARAFKGTIPAAQPGYQPMQGVSSKPPAAPMPQQTTMPATARTTFAPPRPSPVPAAPQQPLAMNPYNSPSAQALNLNSSIVPGQLYSNKQMFQNAHLPIADAQQAAASAGRQMYLPGVSSASGGLQSQAATQAADAMGQGIAQSYQNQMQDMAANAAFGLQGQQARAGDWLSQLGNYGAALGANQQFGLGAMNAMLGANQGMLTGLAGQFANQLSDAGMSASLGLQGQQARANDWLGQLSNAGAAIGANQQNAVGSQNTLLQALAGMGGGIAQQGQNYLNDWGQNANLNLGWGMNNAANWLNNLNLDTGLTNLDNWAMQHNPLWSYWG